MRTSDQQVHGAAAVPRARGRVALLAAMFVLAGCSAPEAVAPDVPDAPGPAPLVEPLRVVATTSILGDLVANILGDDGTVEVLIPAGVDPHAYGASARDAAALRDADLVIANGLFLEEGLLDALDAAAADGVIVVTVADRVDPIEFGSGHESHESHESHEGHDHDDHDDHHDADDHHDHEGGDPHFWWDPIRTASAVELIAGELAAVRPDIDWSVRADAYVREVLAVHEEMVALFSVIPEQRRRIITNHDSLGYLEARYGFEVIGTVIPGSSTSVETNPRAFAALVDLMVAEGISVVFAENTDSTTLAEQLASEVVGRGDIDVTVVRILTDALGAPGSGADTYLGMLRSTAELIHAALAT